jgi:hypothetical protein
MNFKKYKRKGLSEMVSAAEFILNGGDMTLVSISKPDEELAKEEPFIFEQGYIARNPKNHEDMWYVAKKYFDDNLEEVNEVVFQLPSIYKGSGDFGQAIEAAVQGKKVARSGWNGQNMFAYIVPAASYPAQTGVAKEHFGENALVPYRAYWALKTAQEDVATWTPSGSDTLAEDWCIVD